MEEKTKNQLIETLRPAKRMVFFGGAGVSTESGIPDFRSSDGLYSPQYAHSYDAPPEVLLSHSYFMRHPEQFFRFYRDKMNSLSARPNMAHIALAQWEKEGRLAAVITQNIDGLHQAAGSRTVYELHGSAHRNYCMVCGKRFGPDAIFGSVEPVPHCSCGGIIRPDVVLYEEGLDDDTIGGAIHAIMEADVLLVAGTSLTVYPAAGLLRYFGGSSLVLINRDKTAMDSQASLCIHEPVGQVLGAVKDLL